MERGTGMYEHLHALKRYPKKDPKRVIPGATDWVQTAVFCGAPLLCNGIANVQLALNGDRIRNKDHLFAPLV